MVARPAAYRKADVKRAIQAVIDAGIKIGKITVSADGEVTVYTVNGAAVESSDDVALAFDEWMGKHAG